MPSQQTYAIPASPRRLIEAGAYLAPEPLRAAWRQEWLWETWHGHASLIREGATPARAWRRTLWFAAGAIVDAVDLRLEHFRSDLATHGIAKDPAICLTGLLMLFLTVAGWTGGLKNCRAVLAPPFPESGQLVLLSRPLGVLGLQVPANGEQVWTWVESSRWFGSVAGFVLHNGSLEVTPNFFSVLHSHPGSRFRFLGHSIDTIRLLDPARHPDGFSGAIARLKNPADRKAAEAHFARFAVADGSRINAAFLNDWSRWPIYFAAGVSLLFLATGILRIRRAARYQAFFAAKALLVLATVGAAWAEVATALPIPVTGGMDLRTAVPLIAFLLLADAFVMRWALEDQESRCPVCCRLVSMPVSIGSRSSLILDRPGVEFLCTRGHGTLVLSDLTACTGERARWTPVDRSWDEIFVQEKTA